MTSRIRTIRRYVPANGGAHDATDFMRPDWSRRRRISERLKRRAALFPELGRSDEQAVVAVNRR